MPRDNNEFCVYFDAGNKPLAKFHDYKSAEEYARKIYPVFGHKGTLTIERNDLILGTLRKDGDARLWCDLTFEGCKFA